MEVIGYVICPTNYDDLIIHIPSKKIIDTKGPINFNQVKTCCFTSNETAQKAINDIYHCAESYEKAIRQSPVWVLPEEARSADLIKDYESFQIREIKLIL